MKPLYILIFGIDCEGYEVIGIFNDLKLANKAKKEYQKLHKVSPGYSYIEIQKFELNKLYK